MGFSLFLANIPQTHFFIDKKNENKEVAVDKFLPASSAHVAIQYSMYVTFFPYSIMIIV